MILRLFPYTPRLSDSNPREKTHSLRPHIIRRKRKRKKRKTAPLPPSLDAINAINIPNTIYLSWYFISKLITPISTTSVLLRSTTYIVSCKSGRRESGASNPVEVNLNFCFPARPTPIYISHLTYVYMYVFTRDLCSLSGSAEKNTLHRITWRETWNERGLETRGQRIYVYMYTRLSPPDNASFVIVKAMSSPLTDALTTNPRSASVRWIHSKSANSPRKYHISPSAVVNVET